MVIEGTSLSIKKAIGDKPRANITLRVKELLSFHLTSGRYYYSTLHWKSLTEIGVLWDLIKLKTFHTAKKTTAKKDNPKEWEKLFANDMINKGLIPKLYRKFLQLNIKNTTNQVFFSFIFISWRLITLQYCSGFCHTLTRISHGFRCVPHPDPPSHLPLHPIPLGLPSAPGPSTCLMHPT